MGKLERRLIIAFAILAFTGCVSEGLSPLEAATVADRPKQIVLRVLDYCPAAGHSYSDFWTSNQSVRLERGHYYLDYDRDGLPNARDASADLGITPFFSDSNGDGYSDLLMSWGGFTAEAQKSLKLCAQIGQDTDGDGLTDCEEDNILHTDPKSFDTDGDGIPDEVEIRSGLNPKDPNDALGNIERIKLGLPMQQTLTDDDLALGYVYETFARADGCFDFKVSKIPIVDVSNGNLIRLWFFETDASQHRWLETQTIVVPRTVADGAEVTFEYGGSN